MKFIRGLKPNFSKQKKGDQTSSEPVLTKIVRQDNTSEIVVSMPDGWAASILSGALTAIFAWFVPVIFSVLSYWASIDNPSLEGSSWLDALKFGTKVWGLTLGVPMPFAGGWLSVMPLGLTLLVVLTHLWFMSKAKVLSAKTAAFSFLSFVLTSCLVTTVIPSGVSILYVLLASCIIGGVSCVTYCLKKQIFIFGFTRELNANQQSDLPTENGYSTSVGADTTGFENAVVEVEAQAGNLQDNSAELSDNASGKEKSAVHKLRAKLAKLTPARAKSASRVNLADKFKLLHLAPSSQYQVWFNLFYYKILVAHWWYKAQVLVIGNIIVALSFASISFIVVSFFSIDSFISITSALHTDPMGWLALLILQILYVPVILVWNIAYFSGGIYYLGSVSSACSAVHSCELNLPAIPLLSLVPKAELGYFVYAIFPTLTLLVFILLRDIVLELKLYDVIKITVFNFLVTLGAVALMFYVTSGSLASGAMSVFGANIWVSSALLCVQLVGTEFIVMLVYLLCVNRHVLVSFVSSFSSSYARRAQAKGQSDSDTSQANQAGVPSVPTDQELDSSVVQDTSTEQPLAEQTADQSAQDTSNAEDITDIDTEEPKEER